MEESEPQWMRELRERRRATGQSGGRRATPDMLLQAPQDPQNPTGDHQEDLTYGPGIVKKLKSRYISLTLRDSPPKPRPSLHPLRRAASLEHGLDDEPTTPPARKFTPKAPAERPARYRPTTRSAESVKRARSVDTLIRCDSRSDDESLLSPPPPPTPPPQPAPSPERTLRPKRPSPLLKETERPPPDLVKTTLKIFEANPIRRTKSPAYTGQVADKVKSYTVQQCKPKIASKKPTVPPRSPLTSPDGMRIPVSTQTTPSLFARPPPSPKKLILSDRDSRDRSLSPVFGNKHPGLTSPVRAEFNKNAFNFKSPELSPTNSHHKPHVLSEKQLYLEVNKNGDLLSPSDDLDKSFDLRTSTPDPYILSIPTATEISLISPRTPVNPIAFARPSSESSSEDGSYEVAINGNGDDEKIPTAISKSSIENIAKAGTTTQYSFGGVNGLTTNGEVKKSHLPTAKAWPTSPNRNDQSSSDEEVFDEAPISAKNTCLKDKESLQSKASLLAPLTPLLIPNYTIPSEIVPLKRVEILKTTISPPRIKHVLELDPNENSPALILHEESSSSYNNSPLTSREIEKNLINKSKSLEQPVKKVVVSVIDSESKVPKTNSISPESPKKSPVRDDDKTTENSVKVSVNVKSTVVAPPASSEAASSASGAITNGITSSPSANAVGVVKTSPKKPHWQQQQQQQNTMVFNFSNRKEVPDYIENDGIILRSSTRDRPKVSESISLTGLDGESCTDGLDDDADGDWAIWAAGPPSPCDVDFENDNVVINGRSNIIKPNSKPKQLKIKFDDSLTQTFEYPSEASLVEDHTAQTTSPLAVGGSLSTYTPSKVLLQAETYQLGVTKSANVPTTNGQRAESEESSSTTATNGDSGNSTNSACKQSPENHEDEYLKPLRDGDSHNWSHETHRGAGDLLF